MKKGFVILFALVFVLIFCVQHASASITAGIPNSSITHDYSPNGNITGWINFSFSDEPADSLFEYSFGTNSISLIDLLKLNNADFTCSQNPSCDNVYQTTGSSATTTTFHLNKGENKIIGLKIPSGTLNSIKGLNISISSDAAESSEPQLQVDLLNDGTKDWQSNATLAYFSFGVSGCYNSSENQNYAELNHNSKYCERVILAPSPSIKVGAYVKPISSPGPASFTLSIDDTQGHGGKCSDSTSDEGFISCNINDVVIYDPKAFFVCITPKDAASEGRYEIGQESISPVCGKSGSPTSTEDIGNNDFNLTAINGEFKALSSLGTIVINDTELAKVKSPVTDISNNISNYISNVYGNNCSNGCVIPIKFISNSNQMVTVSGLSLKFNAGFDTSTDKLYNITTSFPNINSDFQQIYLDNADLGVPNSLGDKNFELDYKGNRIIKQTISVAQIPEISYINPTTALAAVSTTFTVGVNANGGNITGYRWDFGDGKTETTSANKVSHTYPSIGYFNLTVSATNSLGLGNSKTFNIMTQSPKNAVNFLLGARAEDLTNLKAQVEAFPPYQQQVIKKSFDVNQLNTQITSLQQRNGTATGDNDYVGIMSDLVNLDIPQSIKSSVSIQAIPFFTDKSNIDLNALKDIGGGDYNSTDSNKYSDVIVLWNLKNANAVIDSQEFSAVYVSGESPVMKTFKLTISNAGNSYFVIKDENAVFKDNSSVQSKDGYFYIPISGNTVIEFATSSNYDFSNIPAFISPGISSLSVGSTTTGAGGVSKITILVLAIILLLIVAGAVYIAMREWYKKKYENYLFRNKNDLLNLVSYLESARKRGESESEIAKNLRKNGWSSEKITYVMRKYAGKRTGLI